MNINEYLAAFEAQIQSAAITASYTVHLDRKTEDLAFLAGRIDFRDGSILDFKEFVAATEHGLDKLKYGYNYRTETELLFRYDNAPDPRARDLASYPHHKHQNNGEIISSRAIDLSEVLDEIEDMILRQRH